MNQTHINIATLTNAMRDNSDLPVIFTLNGQSISPGYHITEVKNVAVQSLDCGMGTDQWHEWVIQLLDGNANSKSGYMPARKFVSILDKALEDNQQNEHTELYFEFAPGNAALQKLSVENIGIVDDSVSVSLSGTTAQCKPLERALGKGVAALSRGCCC